MARTKRTTYSDEFKQEALRLVAAGDQSIRQVAAQLGVHVETLRLWRRAAEAAASPETARVPTLAERVCTLERENARLREEREILKKATAFFARTSR
jgi:transposase